MGLPEIYFGMALLLALASGMWLLVPVVVIGYLLMRGAESAGNAVVEAAPPGDVGALGCGGVIIAGMGVLVLAGVLAVMGGVV